MSSNDLQFGSPGQHVDQDAIGCYCPLGELPDDRKNSTSASSKRHPHERKLLTSSPRQVPDRSDFEDFPTDQTALSIALSRRRSRRLRKSVIGQCWNVSAYLSLIACRPKTIASGVNKTASSVNSADAASASLLLYASSSFPLSSPKTASASGLPRRSRCWAIRGSAVSFCCAKLGRAKLMPILLEEIVNGCSFFPPRH